jgi:hypothetical protein
MFMQLKKTIFDHENIKKLPLKVAYFSLIWAVFSTANDTNPAEISNSDPCTLYMTHRATYIYINFDCMVISRQAGSREEGIERRNLTPSVKDLLLLERVRSKMINHDK